MNTHIKKSQGQILFAPWLFFMFLLRDSRSAFRKCLSIFGTSARSLSDIQQIYCANTLNILQKIKKHLHSCRICCIVYVALLWCSGIFMQFFKWCKFVNMFFHFSIYFIISKSIFCVFFTINMQKKRKGNRSYCFLGIQSFLGSLLFRVFR